MAEEGGKKTKEPPAITREHLQAALPSGFRVRREPEPISGGNSARTYGVSPWAIARILPFSTAEEAAAELNALQQAPSGVAPKPLGPSNQLGFMGEWPVLCMSREKGRPLDFVLGGFKKEKKRLHTLRRSGRKLAMLHSKGRGQCLRPVEEGGCCALEKHISFQERMMGAIPEGYEEEKAFYQRRVGELKLVFRGADLPRGFVHGDAFLDNFLVREGGGSPRLVDFEDACNGPFLYDIASFAASIAFCRDKAVWTEGLKHALAGYLEVRRLRAKEARLLVPAMRASLLCNAHFRLASVGRDEANELLQRITLLESASHAKAIERALHDSQEEVQKHAHHGRLMLPILFAVGLAAVATTTGFSCLFPGKRLSCRQDRPASRK